MVSTVTADPATQVLQSLRENSRPIMAVMLAASDARDMNQHALAALLEAIAEAAVATVTVPAEYNGAERLRWSPVLTLAAKLTR